VDLVRELNGWNVKVVVEDPWADPEEVQREYGITLGKLGKDWPVDSLIVAVGHQQYRELSPQALRAVCTNEHAPVIGDLKSLYDRHALADQGFQVFRF